MKRFLIIFIFLLSFPALILGTDKVDINTSSIEQLDKIVGIGPALAQRIIDARPFSSVDDLMRVKGIGEKTLAKIKDQGLACVSCYKDSGEVGSPKNFPGGVYINEIMPNPEGADETNEWIELYNSNNLDVVLAGWKIKDSAGAATTFTMPQDAKILANGFLVLKRPDTKIMLNNDQDGISLATPDNKEVDAISYTKALLGQSYQKTATGWNWSTTPTPAAANIITSPSASSRPKSLPKTEKNANNNIIKAELASASLPVPKNQNPWFLFFTALAITVVSAALVLIIKYKFLSKNHVRT